MIQPNYNIVRKLVPASGSLSHVHNHNKSNLFGLHSCLQALLQHSRQLFNKHVSALVLDCWAILVMFYHMSLGVYLVISWEIHSKTWLLIEMNTKRELNCLEMNTAIEVDSRRLLNNEVLIGPWIILDQRYIIVQIFDIFSFFLSLKFSFWPPYKSPFTWKFPQHPIKHSFKNMALGKLTISPSNNIK